MRARRQETAVELEVPFFDVDALGVVWHGHFFKYLEVARTALLRRRGLDIGQGDAARYAFLVIDSRCRHLFPLRYADRIRVTAWFADVRHRIRIAYEITNLSHDRRAARAHTILATLNHEGRMLMETPVEIQRRLLGE
jgi:acyl-CoA thioester hydrolase